MPRPVARPARARCPRWCSSAGARRSAGAGRSDDRGHGDRARTAARWARGKHVTFESFGQPAVDVEVDFVVVGSGAGGAAAAVILARGGQQRRHRRGRPLARARGLPVHHLRRDARSLRRLGLARHRGAARSGPSCRRRASAAPPSSTAPSWCARRATASSAGSASTASTATPLGRARLGAPGPHRARALRRGRPARRARPLQHARDGRRRRARLGLALHGPLREAAARARASASRAAASGRKQSTNLNYVPEVLERGGDVLSCAPVDRVVFDGTRAAGVDGPLPRSASRAARARASRVRARRGVLVAASATQTPVLLARSGRQEPRARHALPRAPGHGHLRRVRRPGRPERRRHAGLGLDGVPRSTRASSWRRSPSRPRWWPAASPAAAASWCAASASTATSRCGSTAVRAESAGTVKPGLFGGARRPLRARRARHAQASARGSRWCARMHFAAGAREIIPGIYGLPYKLGPDEVRPHRGGAARSARATSRSSRTSSAAAR